MDEVNKLFTMLLFSAILQKNTIKTPERNFNILLREREVKMYQYASIAINRHPELVGNYHKYFPVVCNYIQTRCGKPGKNTAWGKKTLFSK